MTNHTSIIFHEITPSMDIQRSLVTIDFDSMSMSIGAQIEQSPGSTGESL